jgi:hypothetical protein
MYDGILILLEKSKNFNMDGKYISAIFPATSITCM